MPDYPKPSAKLTAYYSRRDKAGNCYWAFEFVDFASGKTIQGKISGGESNIRAILFNFKGDNEWDHSILFDVQDMGIRAFERMVKNWNYAGCNPSDLQAYIKKGLTS
jgi:hypothetical protein